MDLVDSIIAYESGELSAEDTLQLFSGLIADGSCWTLQGSYGRTARQFIDEGYINHKGEIDWDKFNELKMNL